MVSSPNAAPVAGSACFIAYLANYCGDIMDRCDDNHSMRMPGSTIPMSFVQNLLSGAKRVLAPQAIDDLVRQAGVAPTLLHQRSARVTREQFVRLYAVIALTIGDEMLGLWSRPIRAGTLKYLGLSLLDAPSVMVAMYRFTRFWNLLLDDYVMQLSRQNQLVTIALRPLGTTSKPTIFGHELMVKLIHGTASWLVGRELPIDSVGFGFGRPAHFDEYAQLFPGPVSFEQTCTAISFTEPLLRQRFHRTKAELLKFVKRAPDDWLFVTFDHGPISARVRDHLLAQTGADQTLDAVAAALFMSGRSMSRKLALEGGTFQRIKDEIRRDLAIDRLVKTGESIDQVAAMAGFDNTPAFHRAFRAWTGSTPGAYRRATDRSV
jgi:AraC-like DNA-binding protein